ncbi:conjugative transposon protein TraM [Aureivirga sp. CE67]|uniref:conjugative transposon protein TraM n=1 Tax=Aureivirga sp. CE67 TaxID=1788983 RepID=UPI0018CA778E|nr:conjugative transposon protein TraM [Aureivirga sp. CE67]
MKNLIDKIKAIPKGVLAIYMFTILLFSFIVHGLYFKKHPKSSIEKKAVELPFKDRLQKLENYQKKIFPSENKSKKIEIKEIDSIKYYKNQNLILQNKIDSLSQSTSKEKKVSQVENVSFKEKQQTFKTEESLKKEIPRIKFKKETEIANLKIKGNQTIKVNSYVEMLLLEPIFIQNKKIKKGTLIKGKSQINGNRINIFISSIYWNNQLIPVNYQIYNLDGIPGIPIDENGENTIINDETREYALKQLPNNFPSKKGISSLLKKKPKNREIKILNGLPVMMVIN